MKKAIIFLSIIGIILFLNLVFISAQNNQKVFSQPPKVTADAPTLWEKILNFFRGETFTIIGQDRICDAEPYYRSGQTIIYFARNNALGYWSFGKDSMAGGNSNYDAAKYCSSGHGLFDVYCQTNPLAGVGQVGTPRFEMKDSFYFYCSTNCAQCNVELYCCPNDCAAGDSCPSGQTCTTKTATDATMPLKDFNNNIITSYQYCKANQGCTASPTTCWRIRNDGLDCESATYTCEQTAVYKSSCPIGSYIYSSESSCRASLPAPTCVPDNSCAANICTGRTCVNSCGTTIVGIKTDGSCGTITPPTQCNVNWQCSNWNTCINNKQTRTCEDLNSCQDYSNKPVETQTCTPQCTPSWQCADWSVCINGNQTRTCQDKNNCNAVNPFATSQACTVTCTPKCDGKCGGVQSGCVGITCDKACNTMPGDNTNTNTNTPTTPTSTSGYNLNLTGNSTYDTVLIVGGIALILYFINKNRRKR